MLKEDQTPTILELERPFSKRFILEIGEGLFLPEKRTVVVFFRIIEEYESARMLFVAPFSLNIVRREVLEQDHQRKPTTATDSDEIKRLYLDLHEGDEVLIEQGLLELFRINQARGGGFYVKIKYSSVKPERLIFLENASKDIVTNLLEGEPAQSENQ